MTNPLLSRTLFGHTPAGEPVSRYTLANAHGMAVDVITLGGIISAIRVPDRAGRIANVALGFARLDDYLAEHPYLGAIVGRYANRIANAHFVLDGNRYKLTANNGPNTLHGGRHGLDSRLWQANQVDSPQGVALRLHYLSPHDEEGFPGNLDITVIYTVTDDNRLCIDYTATTDRATVVNLSSHVYFNLAGEGSGNIHDHRLHLAAHHYTPVDATLIPTGEIAPVVDTPFDFTQTTSIGARLHDGHPQLALSQGYDHNFVIDPHHDGLALVARVHEPRDGRTMALYSDQPGLQFYTGNALDGSLLGASGQAYQRGAGFCLETQHFPDSPNQPEFPTTALHPGETFSSTTVHHFGTDTD